MLRCCAQVVCAGSAGKGFGDAAKQARKSSKIGKQKQAGVASGDGKVRGRVPLRQRSPPRSLACASTADCDSINHCRPCSGPCG